MASKRRLIGALLAWAAFIFAPSPAAAQNCDPPPGVPPGARYSCHTHTQTQQIGEPSTNHPGGSAGRGWQVQPAPGWSNNATGLPPGPVQCQLEADGSCNCNPRGSTGRNIPCRPDMMSPGGPVTKQYRFTVKSYIAPIGDRLGPTPIPRGGVVAATMNFKAAAVQTDLGFSEDPQSEDKDRGYRLYSHVGLIATCERGRMTRHELGVVLSGVGTEPARPLVGVVAFYPAPMVITSRPLKVLDSGASVSFGWFGKARPAEVIEPFFSAVAAREAVYIWHDLTVTVTCGAEGPQVDHARTKLTGSRFPSHRLWIDGTLVRTIEQGTFSNLWVADPTRPGLIR